MGTVYLAKDESLGDKRVAIKELVFAAQTPATRQNAVRLFQTEAKMLAGLDHPGLIDVTHYFEEQDNQYLVMDFVDGQTLEEVVRETTGFVPVDLCVDWMLQVGSVLEYLHGQTPPVLFRDLKPSNIMLDARGNVRLIDFGIARVFDNTGTQPFLKGAGTAGFAPLEQLAQQGTTDARSDIYSLGATLYSLVTRTIPPSALELASGPAELELPSHLNPAVPAGLEQAILKMMAVRKGQRYQNVVTARQALQPFSSRRPAVPMPRTEGSAAIKAGTVLDNRYQVDKRLASGQMGTVYLAHREADKVAIKVIRNRHDSSAHQQNALREFRRAAEALVPLDHPNVAHVLDAFVAGNQACLVMEYVPGTSLAQVLDSSPDFLDLDRVRSYFHQLCDALEYLHGRSRPVVFRDLKPSNILVTPEGKLVLIDFGLAYVMSPEGWARTDSFLRGKDTHGFVALEHFLPGGVCDVTSDIYSLGATLYAMLTRQAPPAAVELVSGQKSLVLPDILNPTLPPDFGPLIRKMMELQKKDRFQTIGEVRHYLDQVFDVPQVVRRSRLCPKCQTEARPGLETCPACGAALDRRTVPLQQRGRTTGSLPGPAPEPVVETINAAELHAAFRPTETRVSASLQSEGMFLGLRTRMDPVTVVEVSVDGIFFKTDRELKVPSEVWMRLSVPTHVKSAILNVDVRVALTRATEANHYAGLFKNVPERMIPLLGNMERRRLRRLRDYFQVVGAALPTHKALTFDISPSGIGFICEGPLKVGDTLELTLDLSESYPGSASPQQLPTAVTVRIVHCAGRFEGGYRVGAVFTTLSETATRSLYKYLRWRITDKG